MSTFVLIHGGGDSAWSWRLLEPELRGYGHDVVAPDLPSDDPTLTFNNYVETVVEAIGDRTNCVVVGHSFGGFTGPLVADQHPVDLLVLVAGMIPSPGETPDDWWANTGYYQAVQERAAQDGGKTGNPDPYISFFHDVPREVAAEAISRERDHPSQTVMDSPWPLEVWPNVPTKFVLGTQDRFFPPAFLHRLAAERLGITPDTIAAGHCIALSQPKKLASLLHGYVQRALRLPDQSPRNPVCHCRGNSS